MPTVSFGTFAKRKNSTKQPSGLSDQRTVKLKETTSIDRPTFILTGDNFNYNYASWDGRYYFVTDIRSAHNGLTEISCELDPLATYKSEILSTTAYVLYDSVANTELPDNRLPMKTTKSVSVSSVACPLVPDASGTYILSLTGSNGSTGVYKCTQTELAALIDDISNIKDNFFVNGVPSPPQPPSPPTGGSIQDEIEFAGDMVLHFVNSLKWIFDIIKQPISQFFGSGDIPENIRECRFLPFNIGTSGSAQTIFLGTFQTNTSLSKLVTDTVVRSATVSIPWQATDFRRRSPYTEVYLYIPYIGMVRLSSENLAGQSSVKVDYAISVRDGSVICTVSSGSEILGQYPGNVGCSVPIGVSNINLPKAGQSVIAGAASAASKNLGGVGMAALNFADSITPNFTSIGGLDGIAGIASPQNITCYTVFHDTIAQPNTDLQIIGSPSMCPKSLGGLTGFVQCLDAHVEAAAQAEELDAIDSFLNSGFFIE